jgi:hypothetical protein
LDSNLLYIFFIFLKKFNKEEVFNLVSKKKYIYIFKKVAHAKEIKIEDDWMKYHIGEKTCILIG